VVTWVLTVIKQEITDALKALGQLAVGKIRFIEEIGFIKTTKKSDFLEKSDFL
jgi:hypothetical protein